jgi:hypothetical protein
MRIVGLAGHRADDPFDVRIEADASFGFDHLRYLWAEFYPVSFELSAY